MYAAVLLTILGLVAPLVSAQECAAPDPLGAAQGQKKVWTVAYGHDWGAYEYFDQRGYIGGFSGQIIEAVCFEAGINCRLVWDKYTNCWDSTAGQHPSGGRGLMSGWYDACTGWGMTLERLHVFDFAMPYLNAPQTFFFVRPEAQGSFNVNDIRNKNIAFFDGWYSDEKCLARYDGDGRMGYVLPVANIRHVTGPADALPLLATGEIDAIFAGDHDLSAQVAAGDIAKISMPFKCTVDGHAMMTRKDSAFIDHWNRGFQKLRSTGRFDKLCDTANQEHSDRGNVDCV